MGKIDLAKAYVNVKKVSNILAKEIASEVILEGKVELPFPSKLNKKEKLAFLKNKFYNEFINIFVSCSVKNENNHNINNLEVDIISSAEEITNYYIGYLYYGDMLDKESFYKEIYHFRDTVFGRDLFYGKYDDFFEIISNEINE